MTLVMVIRVIDGQVQFDDTVASGLRRSDCIHIDTACPQILTMEIERQVILTDLPCDDLTQGRHDGDGSDIDTVVTVFRTRIVEIGTALGNCIVVLPSVRRLTFADRELFLEQVGLVHDEVQAINTVASVGGLEAETVFVGCVQRINAYRVAGCIDMQPYVRRINVCNIYCPFSVVPRMNGQVQYLDAITSVGIDRSVVMQTSGKYVARLQGRFVHTPAHGVTFADRSINGVVGLLPNVDMNVVNTVVSIYRLFGIRIIVGHGDVIQSTPSERYVMGADIDLIIPDMVGLMDIQRQAVDAITAVDVMRQIFVLARSAQIVGVAYKDTFLP